MMRTGEEKALSTLALPVFPVTKSLSLFSGPTFSLFNLLCYCSKWCGRLQVGGVGSLVGCVSSTNSPHLCCEKMVWGSRAVAGGGCADRSHAGPFLPPRKEGVLVPKVIQDPAPAHAERAKSLGRCPGDPGVPPQATATAQELPHHYPSCTLGVGNRNRP